MSTLFPGAIDSFTTKVDGVTQVLASHVNDLQDSVVAIETVVISQPASPNLLYDTLCHDLWLAGTTFNDFTDDTYVGGTLWNGLHNGQPPDVSGEAAGISGSKRALKCLFDSASSQAGFVQFLTNEDTLQLRGKPLSFSIDVSNLNVNDMRCAILEWTGTADVITSDVVTAWGAGNPTLATNWAYVGAAAVDQDTSAGETRIVCENRTIGATANNIAVFVWNPALEAATDHFRLANAKLEVGVSATDFVSPGFGIEEQRIGWFFNRIPKTNSLPPRLSLSANGAHLLVLSFPHVPPMYKTPTATKNGTWTATNCNQPTVATDRYSFTFFVTATAAGAVDCRASDITTMYIDFDARL